MAREIHIGFRPEYLERDIIYGWNSKNGKWVFESSVPFRTIIDEVELGEKNSNRMDVHFSERNKYCNFIYALERYNRGRVRDWEIEKFEDELKQSLTSFSRG